MWLVFFVACAIWSYHLHYMMAEKVDSTPDLVYRLFMVLSFVLVSFYLGFIIPNEKFFQWNPYQ